MSWVDYLRWLVDHDGDHDEVEQVCDLTHHVDNGNVAERFVARVVVVVVDYYYPHYEPGHEAYAQTRYLYNCKTAI